MTDRPTTDGCEAPTLSVILPCYNEGAILENTYQQLRAYLDETDWSGELPRTWEVLFVNDGSKDETDAIVCALAQRDERVRLCTYRQNGGQGKALQTGFAAAVGQWVFCVDADLDYDPEHIKTFLREAVAKDADVVVGSPYAPGGKAENVPPVRLWMSKAANWYFAAVFGIGLHTFTGIARLYRRESLVRLLLTSRDKDILPEILIKAHTLGMTIVEVPATLRWKPEVQKARGRGHGILTTGRKAFRHLLWGVVENPGVFFRLPILVSILGLCWFTAAVTYLFCREFLATDNGVLTDITRTFSTLMHAFPQTFVLLFMFFFTTMILTCIGLIIYQNKTKKDQDYIYFTLLADRMRQRENMHGRIESDVERKEAA